MKKQDISYKRITVALIVVFITLLLALSVKIGKEMIRDVKRCADTFALTGDVSVNESFDYDRRYNHSIPNCIEYHQNHHESENIIYSFLSKVILNNWNFSI